MSLLLAVGDDLGQQALCVLEAVLDRCPLTTSDRGLCQSVGTLLGVSWGSATVSLLVGTKSDQADKVIASRQAY
jgi:hypothetical protein